MKVPADSVIIDGTGKFSDAGPDGCARSFFSKCGLYTRPDGLDLRKDRPYDKEIQWGHNNMEDFLRRYQKHGITSVIDVGLLIIFFNKEILLKMKIMLHQYI